MFFLLQNYEKRTELNMSQLFSLLIKFYIPTKLFYYFHEYYFVLQQNYKNETKTQHVTNYYLMISQLRCFFFDVCRPEF